MSEKNIVSRFQSSTFGQSSPTLQLSTCKFSRL